MVFRPSSTRNRKLTLVSLLLTFIAMTTFLAPYPSHAAIPTFADVEANRAVDAHTQLGRDSSSDSSSHTSIITGSLRKVTSLNDNNSALYSWGYNDEGELGNGSTTNSNIPGVVSLPDGVTPTAIAAGQFHSLAIGSDGKLYAWGRNVEGQLGNGTNTDSSIPVLVSLPTGVIPTAIAAGQYYSMAIGSDDKLYAWGYNSNGQLGGGTNTGSSTPVLVSLPTGVTPTAIAVGYSHSLAIGSDGKLYAWGRNLNGELGNGTTDDSNIPVVVSLPTGVTPTAIAGGGGHSMTIGSDGKLYAWGYNGEGELGNGSTTNSNIPIVVNLPSGISPTVIAAGGYHSLAIGSDGKLYAWGYNHEGELGNGTTTDSNTPVVVNLSDGAGLTSIAAGYLHSLALNSEGKLYAWGYGGDGQLGNGSNTNRSTPVVVNLPGKVFKLAAGTFHSMAIGTPPPSISLGSVNQAEGNSGTKSFIFTANISYASDLTATVDYATSDGTATALRDYTATTGTLTFSPGITTQTVTVLVKGDTTPEANETFKITLSNPTGLATLSTTLAIGTILNDEPVSLYTWGWNNYGQLGNGSKATSNTPGVVSLPDNAFPTAIAAGEDHSMAIGSDDKLYAWGRNGSGQLGDGTDTDSTTPLVINLPDGVTPTAIAAGQAHSLALGSDGKLYAWGDNSNGQLGDGTNTFSFTSVVVNLPEGVSPTAIAAGYFHSMVIGSDGKLYAWGGNGAGQLGNGTTTGSSTPLVVNLPEGVTPTAITAGEDHSMAIGSDGKLYTWGWNSNGQLGNGSNTDSNIPVVVSFPGGVTPTIIAAGLYHSLALGNDGKLYAWGGNAFGQLGNGTTTDSNTPVVVNLPDGADLKALAAMELHTMALGSDGKLYAWGNNINGQLGNGSNDNSYTPTLINLPGPGFQLAAGAYYSMVIGAVPPAISLGSVNQAEGNSGMTSFVFTATLSYASNLTATVDYATSDGTATAPDEYTATTGTLTFSPGITTQTFIVPVVGDTSLESSESFTVTLSNAVAATISTTTATGTILNDDATVSLNSSPNPALVSLPVTLTATINPLDATGTVTFSEGVTVLGTAPVMSGAMAVYTTSNLSIGSHVITATYSSNSTYGMTVSQPITQIVVGCPLIVTASSDNGTGSTCGTLSYALIKASPGVTITFALTGGNTITFTGSLTTTARVKSGVTLYGGASGSTSRIILNGNGVAGDGLHLAGHNYLYNLTIKKFGGRELVLEGTGNHFKGVVVDAS